MKVCLAVLNTKEKKCIQMDRFTQPSHDSLCAKYA